jgi:hypothetical protein
MDHPEIHFLVAFFQQLGPRPWDIYMFNIAHLSSLQPQIVLHTLVEGLDS